MTTLVLDDFRCEPFEGGRHLSCAVRGADFPERLSFQVCGSNIPGDTTPSADWAVTGLLYPAMVLGIDMAVEAPMSAELRFALRGDVQSLLHAYRQRLQRVGIDAVAEASKHESAAAPRRTATGYSAGVDTFTTLAIYDWPDSPAAITDLTIFDVGAFGKEGTGAQGAVFDRNVTRLKAFAGNRGCDWQTVDTNLADFYRLPKSSFQKTHSIRNASAALALNDLYDTYLYSSSYPFADINSRNDDMAFIEPMLMPLLSSSRMTMVSAGAGFSRLEKMRLVADFAPAFDHLDVCVGSPEERAERANCCKCWKCLRAMITFEALGKLDRFSNSFDLDYYRAHRDDAVRAVTKSAALGKPADRDVLELLSGTDLLVPLSLPDRLSVRLARTKDWIKSRADP